MVLKSASLSHFISISRYFLVAFGFCGKEELSKNTKECYLQWMGESKEPFYWLLKYNEQFLWKPDRNDFLTFCYISLRFVGPLKNFLQKDLCKLSLIRVISDDVWWMGYMKYTYTVQQYNLHGNYDIDFHIYELHTGSLSCTLEFHRF